MELTSWILLAFLTSTLSASESASANSEREQTDQGLHFRPDQEALEPGQCFTTYYCRGTATIPSKPEKTPTCEYSETVVGPDGAIIHTTCPDGPPKPPRCVSYLLSYSQFIFDHFWSYQMILTICADSRARISVMLRAIRTMDLVLVARKMGRSPSICHYQYMTNN